MFIKMYKNQLQEFCQKHKIALPVYKTKTVQGNKFQSEVSINYNHLIGVGKISLNKKSSEKSSAKNLLDNIKGNQVIKRYISDKDIYVLIDMENIHMGNYFELKHFSNHYNFLGFATKNHSSINIASSNIIINTIESSRRDACDIMMIGYTSRLVMTVSNTVIYVVTKDHFGEGLVDYINSLDTKNVEIYNIKSPRDLPF